MYISIFLPLPVGELVGSSVGGISGITAAAIREVVKGSGIEDVAVFAQNSVSGSIIWRPMTSTSNVIHE
jgi:hypothetical protein